MEADDKRNGIFGSRLSPATFERLNNGTAAGKTEKLVRAILFGYLIALSWVGELLIKLILYLTSQT